MEKIKNMFNPGHKKDDEVLYGSGKSDDPVHTGQAGSANAFTSNKTGDDTGPTSAFSGYGNTPEPGANRADIDKPYYEGSQPSTTGTTSKTAGHLTEPASTSRMPGTFDDDTATTASVKSGVIGESQVGSGPTGSSTNKPLPMEPDSAGSGHRGASGAGPHSSSLANKADSRVDSDLDGSKGLGSGLTGTSLPDRSVGSSGYGDNSTANSSSLGRDAALGTLGAGSVSHHHREGQEIGGEPGRSFPLGGSSTTDTSITEPGLGSTSTGIGSSTGPTTGSSHPGSLGRDIPLTGAYNEESWKHDHSAHGHQYGGDPCGGPEASALGAPHFTKGPHALDTANRLDPHVNAGIGQPTDSTNAEISSTIGSGLDSSTGGPGVGSSISGSGLGAYGSSHDEASSTTAGPHSSNLANKADPRADSDLSGQRGTSGADTGLGVTTSSSTTAGPHASNLANKADPRVGSDLSGNQGSTSVGPASGVIGSSADGTSLPSDNKTSGQTTGRDHHLGRDAGLAGAGVAGISGYEAGKQLPGTTPSTSVSDPYSSSDVDPRVDSTSRSGATGLGGATAPASTSRPGVTDTTNTRNDHYGRDAGPVYEDEKRLGGNKYSSSHPPQPSSVLYDSGNGPTTSQSNSGENYGRDAGIVGVGGLAAYESQKHLSGNQHDPSHPTQPSSALYDSGNRPTTTGATQTGYGRDAGLAGTGGATAYGADERIPDKSGLPSETRQPTQSHTGRDAAIFGAAGAGAGVLAGEELSKKDLKHQEKEVEKEQKAHQKELEKEHKAEEKAHQKELAHEQKAHQKELEKEHKAEEKAHQKEIAHEQKAHQKEVEKAEKAHQKEVEKAEKQHEKELSKEEKEHGEKKKHGGILGLFHRDKPDDELKKEELQRKGEYPEPDISRDGAAGSMQNPELTHSHRGTEAAAGMGTAGAGSAGLSDYEQHKRAGDLDGLSESDKLVQARQHDRNRLHKDPPPGYVEKKMEEQGISSTDTGGYKTLPDGRVVEPHTGLPVDLSKGDGAGGTDDTPVHGIHGHGGGA